MLAPRVRLPRDLSVEDAIELGRRSIYHATYRDCASGGTVSGEDVFHRCASRRCWPTVPATHWPACSYLCTHAPPRAAVYHVTEKGWTKVRGDDVTELHFQYYPRPEDHPSNASLVL